MNRILFVCFLPAAFMMHSCGEGGSELSFEALSGKWRITDFEAEEGNDRVEFQECEKTLVYEFTSKDGEALSDGTETKVLNVTNSDACDVFFAGTKGWETNYAVSGGRLFIKNLYLAGTSFSGGFKVKEFDGKKLVLQLFKHTVTLEKI